MTSLPRGGAPGAIECPEWAASTTSMAGVGIVIDALLPHAVTSGNGVGRS